MPILIETSEREGSRENRAVKLYLTKSEFRQTYPYTCPYNKQKVPAKATLLFCVSHAENDRQSTNKNMCNGENSNIRRYYPRCRHFETETVETQNPRQFRIEVHCNMY